MNAEALPDNVIACAHEQAPPAAAIRCPACGAEIALEEAVTRQVRESVAKEFQARLAALRQKEKALNEEIERRVDTEFARRKTELKQQAEQSVAARLAELQLQLQEKAQKLLEAQKVELAMRRKQRELEEKQQTLELEVARKLDEERHKIRAVARQQAAEQERLRIAEKDKLIGDLQKQISELKQKAEQGSQQLQGEVLERELEDFLREHFPHDEIQPVSKGVRGADILQQVRTPSGETCGTIIWETKRARHWSNDWIAKLKADQRARAAEVAVIVAEALPGNVQFFDLIDGIWVSRLSMAIGLATALRQGLLELGQARRAQKGRNDKMSLIYDYLCSVEFRHTVQAIVESWVELKEDLDAEKRAMERQWKKREQQLHRAIGSTAAIYGSLQGFIGRAALPEIKPLQLPGAPEDESVR
jgi:hypothetical protein